MRRRSPGFAAAAGAVVLTLAAAAVGGATGDFRSSWYESLKKPSWQPSGRTIGTVWSILYPMIATAGARLSRRRDRPGGDVAIGLFLTQLVLNAAWTPLFTRAHALRLATVECGALAAVNAALVARAARIDRGAAALLVPYAVWTGFATFLSGTVARLNPPPEVLADERF
jgi:translocator protein